MLLVRKAYCVVNYASTGSKKGKSKESNDYKAFYNPIEKKKSSNSAMGYYVQQQPTPQHNKSVGPRFSKSPELVGSPSYPSQQQISTVLGDS